MLSIPCLKFGILLMRWHFTHIFKLFQGDFRRLKLLYEVHSTKFGGGNLEGGILRMDKVERGVRLVISDMISERISWQ